MEYAKIPLRLRGSFRMKLLQMRNGVQRWRTTKSVASAALHFIVMVVQSTYIKLRVQEFDNCQFNHGARSFQLERWMRIRAHIVGSFQKLLCTIDLRRD
jgi:hypothetical protein